jgi:hypothetical protein
MRRRTGSSGRRPGELTADVYNSKGLGPANSRLWASKRNESREADRPSPDGREPWRWRKKQCKVVSADALNESLDLVPLTSISRMRAECRAQLAAMSKRGGAVSE